MEENTIQERKHQKENVPQIKRHQILNHPLHRISHKTSPSLNNSHKTSPFLKNNHKTCPSLNNSHKMNPPWNSSHKMRPPLKNDHKVKQKLILSLHSSAVMMNHFQIMAQLSELFGRKTPALHQRSQDTAQNHHNTHFNPILLSFILSFQSVHEKQVTLGLIKYLSLVPMCQN